MSEIVVGFDFGGTLVPIIRGALDNAIQRTANDLLGICRGDEVASALLRLETRYWSEDLPVGAAEPYRLLLSEASRESGSALRSADMDAFLDQLRVRFLSDVRPYPGT